MDGGAALKERLIARGRELGFARVGVARAVALDPEGEALRHFVAAGRHAEMGWLADTVEVRADPRHPGMVEGALSVLVFAAPYARAGEGPRFGLGRVARYAAGRDYHNVLGRRLRKIEKTLREEGHRARLSVDSRPVFERAWAERAGLGFVGKNCCLIVPGLGSHLFLACVVTTAELPPDSPMKRRCGDCTACLDACPTDAFVGPHELDARRCISYLTIEHEGAIDDALKPRIAPWVFGGDACQDVCPYNRTSPAAPEVTEPFAEHPRFRETPLESLLAWDDEEAFRSYAQGSPLKRAGRAKLARNAALVLGGAGDRRALPVLREAASKHEDAAAREAAAWAIARLEGTD